MFLSLLLLPATSVSILWQFVSLKTGLPLIPRKKALSKAVFVVVSCSPFFFETVSWHHRGRFDHHQGTRFNSGKLHGRGPAKERKRPMRSCPVQLPPVVVVVNVTMTHYFRLLNLGHTHTHDIASMRELTDDHSVALAPRPPSGLFVHQSAFFDRRLLFYRSKIAKSPFSFGPISPKDGREEWES